MGASLTDAAASAKLPAAGSGLWRSWCCMRRWRAALQPAFPRPHYGPDSLTYAAVREDGVSEAILDTGSIPKRKIMGINLMLALG